jgi:hypothetical protein
MKGYRFGTDFFPQHFLLEDAVVNRKSGKCTEDHFSNSVCKGNIGYNRKDWSWNDQKIERSNGNSRSSRGTLANGLGGTLKNKVAVGSIVKKDDVVAVMEIAVARQSMLPKCF